MNAISTYNMKTILSKALNENFLVVSEPIQAQILHYVALVTEWNLCYNITAHRVEEDLIYKDIVDQILAFEKLGDILSQSSSAMDVGAGAGFSGIILALLHPHIQCSFVDSERKKLNFIRHCCVELGIKAFFYQFRLTEAPISDIPPQSLVISRAMTSLVDYQNYVQNYVQSSAHALYMGGPQQKLAQNEVHQNFEFKGEIQYDILPYHYSRKIFIFQKKISST